MTFTTTRAGRHCLLLGCAAVVAAADWAPVTVPPWSATVVWEEPTDSDLTVGDYQGTWTVARRTALELRCEQDLEEVFTPGGGVFIAWDEREATFADYGRVESKALVLGLMGGGAIHLLGGGPRRKVEPAMVIQGRAGVAFQDGRIERYPDYGSAGSADLPGLRYEFGISADLRLTVVQRFELLAGMAWTAWLANEQTTVVIDGGAYTSIQAEYSGSDLSWRLGGGWRF